MIWKDILLIIFINELELFFAYYQNVSNISIKYE